jgi:hypothetical protein
LEPSHAILLVLYCKNTKAYIYSWNTVLGDLSFKNLVLYHSDRRKYSWRWMAHQVSALKFALWPDKYYSYYSRGAEETGRPNLRTNLCSSRLPQFTTSFTSWNTTSPPWPGASLATEGLVRLRRSWGNPSNGVPVLLSRCLLRKSLQGRRSPRLLPSGDPPFLRIFLCLSELIIPSFSNLLSIVFSGRAALVFPQPSCLRKHLPRSQLLKAARYRHSCKLGFPFSLSW